MRTSGFADATVGILQVRLGKLSQGRWLGAKCWVWRIMCAALHICTASFGVWGRFQYLQKSETAHQSRSRCHQFTHFSRVTPQYALLWSYSFSWTSTGEERWKHWQRIRGTCAGSWSRSTWWRPCGSCVWARCHAERSDACLLFVFEIFSFFDLTLCPSHSFCMLMWHRTCLSCHCLRRPPTETKAQILESQLLNRIVGKSTTVVYPDGNQAWESLCLAKKFDVEAVCHQRKQFTRKTAQKASTRPSLAGTQMIDRAWRSLKFEWLPAHINATQKKKDHTVLSPIVSELVFQWAWRQHQGPMSPNQFLKALQGLLKHWKKWDETTIHECSMQE